MISSLKEADNVNGQLASPAAQDSAKDTHFFLPHAEYWGVLHNSETGSESERITAAT